MNLKEIIKEGRKAKHLTQEEFAEIMGVSRVTVSAWERGTRVPNIEHLKIIEEVLEVKIFNDDSANEMLKIGTTRNISDYKIAKILTEIHKLNLGIKIGFILSEPIKLNDDLKKGEIKILIDYIPNINFANNCGFEEIPIGCFKTCFACSNDNYEKYKDLRTLDNLIKQNLIIPGPSRRRQWLDEFLRTHNIKIDSLYFLPDSKCMADFVINNDFIGYFMEDEVAFYNLKNIKLDEEMPTNPVGVIYSKKANRMIKKIVEIIVNNF